MATTAGGDWICCHGAVGTYLALCTVSTLLETVKKFIAAGGAYLSNNDAPSKQSEIVYFLRVLVFQPPIL